MANKIYSNYSQHHSTTHNNELIIETGNTHFACMVLNKDKNKISALEWFKHEKQDADNFEELLHAIKQGSVLLDKTYSKTHIHINNSLSVLVPGNVYNENLLNDYLNVAVGPSINNESFVEEVEAGESIKNVYRVNSDNLKVFAKHFSNATISHTYSKVLKQMLSKFTDGSVMVVQFYQSEILVVVIKEGKLQFIQSFGYTLGDDVLYYLLSVVQRLDINAQQLRVKISGLIDTHADLFKQLHRYFGNLTSISINEEQALYNINDQPSHYFTHLFNLAI